MICRLMVCICIYHWKLSPSCLEYGLIFWPYNYIGLNMSTKPVLYMKHPQITEIWHRENLLSDREIQGKHREF